MLVLTRKIGERIRIGGDVVLTVLEVAGQRVRLGIEAPDAVPIVRAELQTACAATSERRLGLRVADQPSAPLQKKE